MKTENFYKVSVVYENGSCFVSDIIVEYYKDGLHAKCAFEEFEKKTYRSFETSYDSAEIIVHTDICDNNVMVTKIKASDELLERSDKCKIRLEELLMYV